MSLPKQKDLNLYRGDTTSYQFDVADLTGYVAVTVRFAVKRTDNNVKVIDFAITSTDPGNDWPGGSIQANVLSGMTQAIDTNQSLILRYDLEVTRDDGVDPIVIKTEWFGTINFIPDVTVGNPIITPPTEADIREDLASTNVSLGATLVGVDASFWGALANNVQTALKWLFDNKLKIPSSHIVNRLVKLGAASPDTVLTGITIDGSNNVTGANSVTSATAPGSADALTRKDYVDTQDNLRVAKAGDTMTGNLTIPDGSASGHAVNKGQMDTADGLRVAKAGDSMTGALAMGSNKITGLADGTDATDAVNKGQLDAVSGGGMIKATYVLGIDESIAINSGMAGSVIGEYTIFRAFGSSYGKFMVTSASADAIIINGTNLFVGTDTPGNLCLIDDAGTLKFKNRLGLEVSFTVYRRGI